MTDLKFAFRQLLKNPGFTAVAILTLALGIGANTAIFSVLDAVLLKMLPVKNPEELVALNHAGGDRSGNGFAYPVFERLRDRSNQAFSDLFAFSTWPELLATINGQEQPLRQGVLMVSGEYYSGLGIRPFLGRLITPEDNRTPGGHPVAVLSHGFWQHTYGGDRSVIGQRISLNGTAFTIIGVTPPEFFGVRVGRADGITIPIMMQPQMLPSAPFLRDSKNWDVEVMGRLRPGQTEAQAMAGLRVLFQQIELEVEGGNPPPERLKIIQDRRIDLAPASQGLSELRKQLFGLVALSLAAVGLYGVMAYLVRKRTREIGLRMALGAQKYSVLALVVGQGMKLTAAGLAAGAVTSLALARLIASRLYGITPTDPLVLCVVPALLAAVAFLASYLPVRRAAKFDPMEALRYE